MKNWTHMLSWLMMGAITIGTAYYLFLWPGPAVQTMVRPVRFAKETVVIDAGHGGEDGGAVSPAGNVESGVNLAVAQRLDAVFGLYGADVVMLRTEDVALHDATAQTMREKKVSDIHNRVARVEDIPNATLISIHQNSFPSGPKYHGAQVLYANDALSLSLAQHTQEILRQTLDPENSRQAKQIPETVYLMNHITCRAILVECGFLTNPAEDALLQTGGYQTKIATALAGAFLGHTEDTNLEGDPLSEG